MDPKYVRKTIDNLLADLRREPRITRKPGLMARYGRPLGFSAALSLGAVAGCTGTTNTQDALPTSADAYGLAIDSLPKPDAGPDVLPPPRDAYGIAGDAADRPDGEGEAAIDVLPSAIDTLPRTEDVRAALDFGADIYGVPSPDAREVLPSSGDLYGAPGDRVFPNPEPVDVKSNDSLGD